MALESDTWYLYTLNMEPQGVVPYESMLANAIVCHCCASLKKIFSI